MSEVTFEAVMAYQRKRRALAQQRNSAPVETTVEEQKEVEQEQKPDYAAMSKSDLYKLAKENGCELPWVSKVEDFIAYLNNA